MRVSTLTRTTFGFCNVYKRAPVMGVPLVATPKRGGPRPRLASPGDHFWSSEVDERGQEEGHLQPHERGARPIARPLRMWAGSCGVSAHVETPPRRMIFCCGPHPSPDAVCMGLTLGKRVKRPLCVRRRLNSMAGAIGRPTRRCSTTTSRRGRRSRMPTCTSRCPLTFAPLLSPVLRGCSEMRR